MYTSGLDFRNAKHAARYNTILRTYFPKVTVFERKIAEPVTTVTRARKHTAPRTLFPNIDDAWYPPKKYALINRANDYGEPIFYCATKPGTTILEVKPSKVGEWITTIDIDLPVKVLDLLAVGAELTDDHLNGLDEVGKGVHMFLRDKFTQKIPPDESHLYHLTIAFIDLFIGNKHGVIYPSVASNLKGYNIALKTEFIDNYKKFFGMATVHEITAIRSEYDLDVKCMYRAYELNEHGDFIWERVTDCDGHSIDESIYE